MEMRFYMEKTYLPLEHHYRLIKGNTPKMRWDGKEDISAWQSRAKEKLAELLGLDEIEKFRVPLEVEIEFDKYTDDLDAREIRFRFTSEKNVVSVAHLFIPRGYEGKKLPIMVTVCGHGTGMHLTQNRAKFPGDKEILDRKRDTYYIPIALSHGLAALSLEQRGFGENGGNPVNGHPRCTEIAKRAIILGRTLIGERIWDIMRCIDALHHSFSNLVDLNKILMMGNSGGGTATTYASVFDDRIKISIPSCAVCDWSESIGIMEHCFCNYVPYIAKHFDMGDIVAIMAPKRAVVVSGIIDNGFLLDGAESSVATARRVYSALGESDNLVHVIGQSDHRFYADDSYPHIMKFVSEI